MGNKKKKYSILFIILLTVISLSAGFSAFQKQLFVSDVKMNVRLEENVRVSNATVEKVGGSAVSNSEDYNVSRLIANATFPSTSSYVLYKIDLTNFGNVKSGLLDITNNSSGTNFQICDANASNCTSNVEIPVCNGNNCTLGTTKEIYVKVTSSSIGTKSINLDFDFEPYNNVTYSYFQENTSSFKAEIMSNDTYEITLTSDVEEVEVSGTASVTYNKNNHKLTISNVGSDITISAKYKATDIAETYTGTNPNNYVLFNNTLFRIIGSYNVVDGYGNTEERVKIVKHESIGNNQFDTTSNDFGSSNIKNVLNITYYGTLSNEAKAQIDTALWTSTSVEYVGLISGNDFTNNNTWLTMNEFTLTPGVGNTIKAVNSNNLVDTAVTINLGTYPVVYLKTDTLITGGDGTSTNPYTLESSSGGLQSNPTVITGINRTVTGSYMDLVTVTDKVGTPYYSTSTLLTESNYNTDGSSTVPSDRDTGTYSVYYYIPAGANYKAKSGRVTAKINGITYSVAYTKGANITSIGKTTDTCTTSGHNLTCSVVLPSITPSAGYENGEWSDGNNVYNPGANYTLSNSDKTLTSSVRGKTYVATFNTNGATSVGEPSLSCTVTTGSTCNITLPSITRDGFTIDGWSTNQNATSGTSTNTSVTLSDNVTYYALSHKDITITFNKNGNTSQTPNGGTASTETTVSESCTIRNSATTCSITSPTITMAGFTIDGYSTGATTYSNYWAHNTQRNVSASGTWYAQTSKAAKTITITFNKNGNTAQIPNGGASSSENTITQTCNAPEVHNGASQSCNITSPTISAPAGFSVLGYSDAADDRTITWETNTQKSVSANKTYFAQSSKATETFTIKFYKNGATSQTPNGGSASTAEYVEASCSTGVMYNGTTPSCKITTPTITKSGWTVQGYSANSNDTTATIQSNTQITVTSSATYYAITTKTVTATFYYNSNTNSGSLSASSTSQTCSMKNTDTYCTPGVPSAVSGSVGKYNSTYKGVSSSLSSITESNLQLSENTTLYAIYSSPLTIYYPNTSNGISNSNNSLYRNEYFTSTSAMSTITATSQTSITQTSSVSLSNIKGTFQGINSTANTTTKYAVNSSTILNSNAVTYYAVTTSSENVTFKYNSNNTCGSATISTATQATTITYYCQNTTTMKTSHGTTTNVPNAVTSSKGQYNSNYRAIAAVNSLTTVTTFTGGQTYYAVYSGSVTNYYYNGSAYTSRTLYRNEYLASASATTYTVKLADSNTGTSDYTTAVGPGNSVWSGLSTAQDTTAEYSTVALAAASCDTTLYTIYTFNVTYAKGANVNAIGSENDSCKVTSSNTSCNVTLPSITSNANTEGYTVVGWNTTNGATTGTAAGQTYAISTNNITLYANAIPKVFKINLDSDGATSAGTTEVWYEYKTSRDISGTTCYYYSNSTLTTCLSNGWSIVKPSFTDNTYVGYFVDKNGSGTQYVNTNGSFINSIYTKIPSEIKNTYTNEITLYAKWKPSSIQTPTISGGSTKVYNRSDTTITCNTASTYSTGTNITYEFGYATSTTNFNNGTITWLNDASTTKTRTISKTAFRTVRYYTCRVYASDGTNTTSTVQTTATTTVGFVNARIDFDATTNGGTLGTGTNPMYVPYGQTNKYTSRTGTTAATIPSASKTGWTFTGWYTTSGAKVIAADGAVQTGVTNWTDSSGNWILTSASNTANTNKLVAQFTGNTFTATFEKNGVTSIGSPSLQCTVTSGSTCTVEAPTITRSGWTIDGWNTDPDATTGTSVGQNLTLSGNATYYAITHKDVTLTFYKNGNTSQTPSGGSASTATSITQTCTMRKNDENCSITAPTIAAPTGFTVDGYSTGATTYSNYWHVGNAKTFSANAEYYAQSTKAAINRTMTLYKNGNTSFTYSGSTYTDTSKSFTICTIPAVHNGATQDSSCSATITMATITQPSGFTVIGWSTGASVRTATYTSGQTNVSLIMDANKSFYAQSSKAAVTLTAKWNANGATLSSTSNTTCQLAIVYNGASQATSCEASAPTITRSGYTIVGFNDTASATTSNSAYNSSTNKITLTSALNNKTWYAITYKDITLTFYKNGNYSQTNASGTAVTDNTVTRTCRIQNSATSCAITAPTMVAASGFTIKGYSTGADTHSGYWTHNTEKTGLTANANWYAQSEKVAINRTMTLYRNGNTSFTYNGTTYTDTSKSFTICTIPAVYNGATQDSSCSATITMATITQPSGFTNIGWSTGATNRTATYTSGQTNVSLTMDANKSFYAQSSKAAINRTMTLYKNGNTSFTYSGTTYTDNSKSFTICTIPAVYNGATQNTSCSATITMATITAPTNYTQNGWGTSATATTATYTSGQTNVSLTMDANKTYYALKTLNAPTPAISGGATKVYGNAVTLTCSSTPTYASGTSVYYSFGYSTTDGGSPSGWTTASTTATYNAPANYTTRYYSCRAYANDGTITSSTNTTAASADQQVTYVNARIDFDATTNGGTLGTGTNPMYVPYNNTTKYTTRTGTTAATIPTASKDGWTFTGWFTAASGGTKVIDASGNVQASVSGWTDANKKWLLTSTSDTANTNRLYAQFTGNTYTATIHYNSNTTNGQFTDATTTTTCTVTSGNSCTIIYPNVVTNSVGKYNSTFSGIGTEFNMTGSITLTEDTTFYTHYSEPIKIYYPNTSDGVSNRNAVLFRNEYYASATTMSAVISNSTGITTQATTTYLQTALSNIKGMFVGINSTVNSTTYYAIDSTTIINSNASTYYAVTTVSGNATFHYNSNSTVGYFDVAQTTSSITETHYCTSTSAQGVSIGTPTIPSVVTSSVGQYNSPYIGLADATNKMTTTTSFEIGGLYYAVYSAPMTVYYPNTSDGVSSSSTSLYKNEFFANAGSMSAVLANSPTVNTNSPATDIEFTNMKGTLLGYNSSLNTYNYNTSSIVRSDITTAYAIVGDQETVTFKYNSNQSNGGFTNATATGTASSKYYCATTSTVGVNHGATTTVPTVVSNSVGKYNNTFAGLADNYMKVSKVTSFTGGQTYYAVYGGALTIYYPNTSDGISSSNTALYRHEYYDSPTTMTVVTSTSATTTTQATNTTVGNALSNKKGTFAGINSTANTTTKYAVNSGNVKNSNAMTYYSVMTTSENASFKYNSNTTSGSLTVSTATQSTTLSYYCQNTTTMKTSHGSTTTVPSEVSSSVGKYNSSYYGIASSTGSMTKVTSFTGGQTYYAIYSSDLTISYPNTSNTISSGIGVLKRNEYFTSDSAMNTITSTSSDSTTQATTVTLQDLKGTFAGLALEEGNQTPYAVNSSTIINTDITNLFAITTANENATFHYNSNTTSGSFTDATATSSTTATYYVTLSNTMGTSHGTTSTVPSAVSSSVGKYNSAYKGISSSSTTISNATSFTGGSTYYAYYSTRLTIYYPSSTSACSNSTSINIFRNEYYSSTTAMSAVISNSQTGTTAISSLSVSGILGTFKGLTPTVNSTNYTTIANFSSTYKDSATTAYYAVSTSSENATFHYNSNTTSGSFTDATATQATTRTNYCNAATTATVSHGTTSTVPSAVSSSVGKYNSAYKGISSSSSTITNATTFTGGSTYYAYYSTRLTIYYPSSASACSNSTSLNIFRNEYFTSASAMGAVISASQTSATAISSLSISGIQGTFGGLTPTVNSTDYTTIANFSSTYKDSDVTSYYAVSTTSENATIHYNSNTTSGSFTDATATTAATSKYRCLTNTTASIYHGSTSTIPSAVSSSVGKYNSAYKGISGSSTGITNVTSFTGGNTYYAYYSTRLTIYYPSSTSACSNSTSINIFRNEYYSSTTAMSAVISNSQTGTTAISSLSVSGILGTFKGLTPTVNSTSYTTIANFSSTYKDSATTAYYAVSTSSENASFKYNSNTTSGSLTVSTATQATTRTNYCNAATTATVSHGTTSTVPSAVSSSVGKYNSAYKGISSSSSTISNATSFTGGSTYYAYYSTRLTIYYPNAATTCTNNSSSLNIFRNEYFTSASAMGAVISASQTSATAISSLSISGLFKTLGGLTPTVNSSSYTAIGSFSSSYAASATTSYYAVTTENENATFYYNNNTTCGSATLGTATQATTKKYYCSSNTAGTSAHGTTTTVPSAVSSSKGQYNSAYRGISSALSTTGNIVTTFTGGSSYYAVYSQSITNNYYNSSYTTRTIYRNEYLTSVDGITMVARLSTSNSGATNFTHGTGPNSAAFAGFSKGNDSTPEFTTTGAAATSSTCDTTYYSVYKYRIDYAIGANVSSIGATTATCNFVSGTTCSVTLPTITPVSGFSSVGWSTTNGATSGTAAGASYTVTNNTTKLYANAVGRNILAAGNTGTTTFFNSSPINKNKVKNIIIQNTTTAPSGSLGSWDASYNQNNSVIAYYVQATGGLYDVYLTANGNILTPVNSSDLFHNFTMLNTISGWQYLDTSLTTNMSQMFMDCNKLQKANISWFDTSKVTNMQKMFWYCNTMSVVWLGNIVTTQVTTTNGMFGYCSNLRTIYSNVNFDTGHTYDSDNMFLSCSNKLKGGNGTTWSGGHIDRTYARIDVSGSPGFFTQQHINTIKSATDDPWDGSYRLFLTTGIRRSNFESITFTNSINGHVSNGTNCFDVSADGDESVLAWVTDTNSNSKYEMTIGARGGTIYTGTDASALFSYMTSLSSFTSPQYLNTSAATTMVQMFVSDANISTLNLSSFSTNNVTNMTDMFSGCTKLSSLNISNFNTAKVTDMTSMFYNCSKLTSLNLNHFNTAKVTSMRMMFCGCSLLATLTISSWSTPQVTDMYAMFNNCSKLSSLTITNFNTSKVTDMEMMFMNCSTLTSLNLRSFNTSTLNRMTSMFEGCSNLVTIYASTSFVTTNVLSSYRANVFKDCTKIVGGNGTTYINTTSGYSYTYARIDTASTPGYFTSGSFITPASTGSGAVYSMLSDEITASTNAIKNLVDETVAENKERDI